MAFTELRTTFAGRSVVPDVSVFRWDRIPRNAAGELADECRLAPDVAIEILSPGQSTTRLMRRCLWYVEHDVRIALLVDPEDRSVFVFGPGGATRALRGTDPIDFGDVIPGFQLRVQELFAALRAF
jgi:Uma2 family endonuclease